VQQAGLIDDFDFFNQLGQQGWELVHCEEMVDLQGLYYPEYPPYHVTFVLSSPSQPAQPALPNTGDRLR
jgi:hypothetical protein